MADEKNTVGERYKVGTLSYTLPSLLLLMVWLLWGDFCFTLMESVFPSVVPLMLGQLAAPNWLIALFLTTIPNLLNATVCPVVSFCSDRHRSPFGRRIPFIVRTIPFICLFLALIGLAPHLAAWAVRTGVVTDARILSLILIGLFTIGFQFFHMFVASVYYYLFNDVVPPEFLGRFLAAFRFVGAAASGLFYFYIFPKAETHYVYIFLGAALIYGVGFWLMCRNVREGSYPAPPPASPGMSAFRSGFRAFWKECFTNRFYWFFYLGIASGAVAFTSNVFVVFFSRSVGLSLEQFGMYSGAAAVVSAVLLFPCGFLADKFHPLRMMVLAVGGLAVVSLFPLVFLFVKVDPQNVFAVWCGTAGLSIPFITLLVATELPTCMQILPKDRFGQFASATAMVRSLAALSAGLLCGLAFDFLKGTVERPETAYWYLPIWPAIFHAISAAFLFLVYLEWKRLGGREHFRSPASLPNGGYPPQAT